MYTRTHTHESKHYASVRDTLLRAAEEIGSAALPMPHARGHCLYVYIYIQKQANSHAVAAALSREREREPRIIANRVIANERHPDR